MVSRISALHVLLLTILLSVVPVSTQFIGPDPHWLNPNGSKPDFSTAYTNGDQITLSWQGLNNSISDLWVTSYDVQTDNFAQLVTTGINLTNSGTYLWRININTTEISLDSRFVLRFVPTGIAYYTLLFTQFASPGFLLANQNQSSQSTSSASAATNTASTTATSNPSPPSSSSSSTTAPASVSQSSNVNSSSSTELSGGAKAGIAVGVIVGVLVILGFAGRLFWSWQRRRRNTQTPASRANGTKAVSLDSRSEKPDRWSMHELRGDHAQPSELSGVPDGRNVPGQHELEA